MNIRSQRHSEGGALLGVLVGCSVIAGALASYLALANSQSQSVLRSQAWNSAMPLCEAGVEEGLAHINNSVVGTNYAVNGWTVVSNKFQMQRTLGEGRYVVTLSTNTYPTITSYAFTRAGTKTNEIMRVVQVTTTRWATGMKGMIARYDMNVGANCEVDSFDSEDTRYSSRGRYDASKRKDGGYLGAVSGNVTGGTVYGSVGTGPTGTASGNIGDASWLSSNSGVQPGHYANDVNLAFPEVQVPFDGAVFAPAGATVTLTNFDYWSTMITTDIYPSTPPASGIITNEFGTNIVTTYPSSINAAIITTNSTATRTKYMPAAGTYFNLSQQGSWYYYNLVTGYSYPARTYTYSMTATNASVTTEYYDFVLTDPQYQMANLALSGGQRMLVLGTDVSLYVPGDFTMSGSSKLIIAPGATLKVYVGGATSLAGNGVFNYTLDASHFMYYGLPSNTSIDISGNASFTGCIYAPKADLRLNGGGSSTYDIVGAAITKTVTMTGHFRYHYDERLGRSPIQAKFSVAHWQEI